MKKAIALTTCTTLLAGCSNIGAVNGIPVGKNAQVSTQGSQTYCQANPAIYILGVVVGVGVLGYITNEANDGGSGNAGGDGDQTPGDVGTDTF